MSSVAISAEGLKKRLKQNQALDGDDGVL